MSLILALLSFIGIALLVFVGIVIVWCLIAGLFHGTKIISSYLWWIGALLFWVAVAAVVYLLLFR